MEQRFQILNSKLLPPYFGDTIKRARLYPLLDEIPKKKLTTVIAGAGYGKTTLIAQVGNSSGLDAVWYRLDKSDRDFTTFLSYLISGLNKHFSGFGAETLRRIEETQILSSEREIVLTVFLREVEKFVQKDIMIILDDYHIIQNSQEINDSTKFLLERLSPLVHLIIISRTAFPLSLSRFRAMRQVLDIREEDLAFTIPEIKQLFLQLFDISLPEESLKSIHQKTDGWVSGLILFYHSLRGKNPREVNELLLKLKGSHRLISNYLEENVYELLRDDLKDFLLRTSILSRLNAEFCDQYLKIDNSRDTLIALEENHFFTFSFDEERRWFYYHHLFQDFLQTKLHREFSQKYIINLHKDAAILLEKMGKDEDALEHYFIAEQFEEACELFKKMGRKLIKAGRIKQIHSYLKRMPESYIDREPWIQYTKAKALDLSGKSEEAIYLYKKSQSLFRKYETPKGIVLCLSAMSSIYFLSGDYRKAQTVLKELLKQTKGIPFLYINVLGSLISVSSHLMKMNAADKYFTEAMSLLARSKNNELLAWLLINQGFRYVRTGDFKKARNLGLKGKALCKNLVNHRLTVLDYHLISWSCYYLGLFEEGIEHGKKGLELYKEKGFRDGLQAWFHIDLSLNYTGIGCIKEAIYEGEESLEICQNIENKWTQPWAYHVLYVAYMQCGNFPTAEEFAKNGIELIKGLVMPIEEGFLKSDLVGVLLENRQWSDALPLLTDAERLLKKSKLYLCKVYLMSACCFWEQKQKETALSKLLLGLQLCEANQYDVWVIAEKKWIIPLLIEIFSQGKMQGYLMKIFKEIGSFAREELVLLQESKDSQIREASLFVLKGLQKGPSPGLRVYCLGKFKVFRGEEEIPDKRWKSKKAKMLFKYLIYARPRGYLAKEVLMELLWPEEDPEKTVNRLHDALTSLRRILEPEIIRGTPSSYLVREGDSYKLCLGDGGFVDIDEFAQELKFAKGEKNPEKAISHYFNAESLYGGDFLEEDMYIEWCQEKRERLKEEYLELLLQIIGHFDKICEYVKCIEYAIKYLKWDTYDENIYQELMKYYSLIGNKAMVVKTFDKCKKSIMNGLDSPLSKETKALFQKLASN